MDKIYALFCEQIGINIETFEPVNNKSLVMMTNRIDSLKKIKEFKEEQINKEIRSKKANDSNIIITKYNMTTLSFEGYTQEEVQEIIKQKQEKKHQKIYKK